ncbi:putative integral membrane protein [Bradyrhizobium sp. ORS 375]|uniref:hypothetical protein n=1 Tax=Bradyrhizobium sp. (strain ORS 375) TaxID=566679 RepID=UPI0002408AC1|nr:hypothetical protein [Bradyrhizobium sp. ORS 375]CCD90946.1 putative integral membrane protein [Bradyrhizobium sp. ORS 375]
MPTLESNRLVFRFPHIEESAQFSIEFQRTLRIPDTDRTYSLPPGLGLFPLRHVEDFADRLDHATISRGGVVMPMWQAEAMWLNFHSRRPYDGPSFPVAIKVAAGKINAVSGETWRPGLNRHPQDYMVSPQQPWLDGFAVKPGVIRQFVAMPLGDGYTVEHQISGTEEWGGLQIQVAPLKNHAWQKIRAAWREKVRTPHFAEDRLCDSSSRLMGLGAGGLMKQAIYPDQFQLDDWDLESMDRVFVTLLHARDWKSTTGESAPHHPPTAQEYSKAGLPWFDYYGCDQASLPGGEKLASIASVGELFKKKTGAAMPNCEDVETGVPKIVGPRQVRVGEW